MEENLKEAEKMLNELYSNVSYLAARRDYMACCSESRALEAVIDVLELLGYEVKESEIRTKKVGKAEYGTREYTVSLPQDS